MEEGVPPRALGPFRACLRIKLQPKSRSCGTSYRLGLYFCVEDLGLDSIREEGHIVLEAMCREALGVLP